MQNVPQPLLQTIYRPAPKPSADLPMGVPCAGHYRLVPPFLCGVETYSLSQLFWCVKGQGIIVFNEREHILKPHQVAIYSPGMLHKWYARWKKEWDFYFLTVDGPFAVPILNAFGLTVGIHNVGPVPVALFRQLKMIVREPTKQAEIRASAIAYNIISMASMRQHEQTDEIVLSAIEHINQEWASPDLNVKTLSDSLRLHRSTLSRRFQRVTGGSPTDYIARLRIHNAMTMLQHTALPVVEIARQCGYTDQGYLARMIRRLTGVSPRRLRKNISRMHKLR